MNGGDELSLKDVTFLRAIRDINESPERYASTEAGVTPATVTAITEATTLSEEEVAYRLDHPRLGKSGLVKVYEAGPPGDDSAGLNSAKLTEAGEATLAAAEERQDSVDSQEWQPDDDQSEFDDVQEWEPADVEGQGTAATSGVTAGDGGSGGVVTESASISEPAAPATTTRHKPVQAEAGAESGSDGTVRVDEERLAALESRLDELEAEQAEAPVEPQPANAAAAERVESLSEEVAALRETTESLEESLETALETVEEMKESEYGALDEKREEQFQTAVKSMVAFHQLATEVLDVRVENYEPAAGHPDADRVEITRNRIGDALGVGQSGGGGGGIMLSSDDSNWPDGGGANEFDGGSGDDSADSDDSEFADDGADDEPELESDAPESGVYPPIDGEADEDSTREATDDEPEPESDVPESGVYPPIGDEKDEESDEEGTDTRSGADEADPSALGVDVDADVDERDYENIRETASEEGHLVEPIRSTGQEELPLSLDPASLRSVSEAVVEAGGEPADAAEDTGARDALPAESLEAETLLQVWSATTGGASSGPTAGGLPAVPMEPVESLVGDDT